MREYNSEIGVVRAPEFITFAFNPNIITVETEKSVTVEIGNVSDTREAMNGVVEIDVSLYLQALVSKDERHVSVSVKLSTEDGSFIFGMLVVWGAISIGESWNEPQTVRWQKGKEFVFELYIPSDATVYVRYDGEQYVEMDVSELGNIASIDPSVLWPDAERQIVIRVQEGEIRGVFDYTFDHTFNGQDAGQTLLYRIEVLHDDDCGSVYLRWIDWHGWQRYWMFRRGERQDVVKAGDVIEEVRTAYGRHYKHERIVGKEVSRRMSICAPLVDEQTFEMLTGLAKSMNVEMLMKNGEWLPVNIDGQSITRAAANVARPLNDFECVMLLPEVMIPKN